MPLLPASRTAAPQPAKTSTNVPRNSAPNLRTNDSSISHPLFERLPRGVSLARSQAADDCLDEGHRTRIGRDAGSHLVDRVTEGEAQLRVRKAERSAQTVVAERALAGHRPIGEGEL